MNNTVTLKVGKASIVCRPEDVAKIMAQIGGTTGTGTPVYEKSAEVHKAIRNIKADNAEELVIKSLAGRTGLHTVFSGLNDEIRTRYNLDPVKVTNDMIANGILDEKKSRPSKRGFWIVLK